MDSLLNVTGFRNATNHEDTKRKTDVEGGEKTGDVVDRLRISRKLRVKLVVEKNLREG